MADIGCMCLDSSCPGAKENPTEDLTCGYLQEKQADPRNLGLCSNCVAWKCNELCKCAAAGSDCRSRKTTGQTSLPTCPNKARLDWQNEDNRGFCEDCVNNRCMTCRCDASTADCGGMRDPGAEEGEDEQGRPKERCENLARRLRNPDEEGDSGWDYHCKACVDHLCGLDRCDCDEVDCMGAVVGDTGCDNPACDYEGDPDSNGLCTVCKMARCGHERCACKDPDCKGGVRWGLVKREDGTCGKPSHELSESHMGRCDDCRAAGCDADPEDLVDEV